jgi:pantoate--beta-alanine ligase
VKVVATAHALRAELEASKRPQGLVPTMGALHAGHVALLRAARAECEFVTASIFVNPAQFGPDEDLATYPGNRERDLAVMEREGVDIVFAPATPEIYPDGFDTTVSVGRLSQRLEGESRPGHFQGVATVVCKLLAIARPDRAYFGEKDAQQLLVIQRMTADLALGVQIVPVPTVREPDGLALSSRNAGLTDDERAAALGLYAGLSRAHKLRRDGESDAETLRQAMRTEMGKRGVRVDYVSVADPQTLDEIGEIGKLAEVNGPALALVAGFVGETRLIDNMAL